MPTIHPTDYRYITAMLGLAEPPKELEQEYFTRLRMLHLAGLCGPLGATAIIDLIRSLGFEPPEPAKPDVHWERYPQDGTIRVEAKWHYAYESKWLTGVFRGLCDNQGVAVQVDGEPILREFMACNVRLAADQAAKFRDTMSRNPGTLCSAPRDMEVPDIGPDDPTETERPPVAEASLCDPSIMADVPIGEDE